MDEAGPDAGIDVLNTEFDAVVDVVFDVPEADVAAEASSDAPDDAPGDRRDDAPSAVGIAFLGSPGAYDETTLIAFLAAYPAHVTRLSDGPPITPTALVGVDVLILDQLSRTFDATEAAVLADWVHAGGALLSLTGFANTSTDATLPNSLLADLPLGYAPSFVGLTPALTYVTTFTPSPVTAGLRAVPFWGGHGVIAQGACDGPTQSVAFLAGDPVGATCVHGMGRLYLWGDEWVEYSSQWTSTMDTRAFWQDAIDWLTAPAQARGHAG
jgi:hypothetical protein